MSLQWLPSKRNILTSIRCNLSSNIIYDSEHMYLFAITLGQCSVYTLLFFIFPFFFDQPAKKLLTRRSLYSLTAIVTLSFIIYVWSGSVPDPLGNRLLHFFGGGMLTFFVCFLAVRDTGIAINKLQFFLFSFMAVTSLGVANEIVEFLLQNYCNFAHFIFADSINDTWLDLVSNTTGALLASVCLVPLMKKPSK